MNTKGITFKYFPQAKQKVVNMALNILRAIYNAFDESWCIDYINDEDEVVRDATVLEDEIIH